jgi:hypothetical protein
MKDADYRVFDEGIDDRRYACRLKCLKDYAMAFAIGVGVGMGAMMGWYETHKLYGVNRKQPEKSAVYETVLTNYGEVHLTQKQIDLMVKRGLSDIERKNGRFDTRILDNWYEILCRQGPRVIDEQVKKLIDETLNPATPMGKLLNKYRGPKSAPEPSQADEERYEELCQKYELYQPSIDALMDENHDNELTREERNKGLYKLLHQ